MLSLPCTIHETIITIHLCACSTVTNISEQFAFYNLLMYLFTQYAYNLMYELDLSILGNTLSYLLRHASVIR